MFKFQLFWNGSLIRLDSLIVRFFIVLISQFYHLIPNFSGTMKLAMPRKVPTHMNRLICILDPYIIRGFDLSLLAGD